MNTNNNVDWNFIVSHLPEGWVEQAKILGALKKRKKFKDVKILLRVLLIYLVDGCSLRETAARARIGKIAQISDVALLKRLKASGEWFLWMSQELKKSWIKKETKLLSNEKIGAIKIVDGSIINEPGATGSTWRIHYAVNLATLKCEEILITDIKKGESFKNYKVDTKDLFIGDYSVLKSLDKFSKNLSSFSKLLVLKKFGCKIHRV
jgi:hypothetical protein